MYHELKAVLDIVNTAAAVFVAYIAFSGVNAWKREHKGKRNIDLAEETLALFYEAAEAISFIRSSISFQDETADIKPLEGESEKKYQARKNASIVFKRYEKYQELFNKIYSIRYRFMAQIGKDKAKPFDDLRAITNEIFSAARKLALLWPKENFRTEQQEEAHFKKIEDLENIFWDTYSEEDPIAPKVRKLLEDIEKVCKEEIFGST